MFCFNLLLNRSFEQFNDLTSVFSLEVLWELDVELNEKVSLLLVIFFPWHSLASNLMNGLRSDHSVEAEVNISAVQGTDFNWAR